MWKLILELKSSTSWYCSVGAHKEGDQFTSSNQINTFIIKVYIVGSNGPDSYENGSCSKFTLVIYTSSHHFFLFFSSCDALCHVMMLIEAFTKCDFEISFSKLSSKQIFFTHYSTSSVYELLYSLYYFNTNRKRLTKTLNEYE